MKKLVFGIVLLLAVLPCFGDVQVFAAEHYKTIVKIFYNDKYASNLEQAKNVMQSIANERAERGLKSEVVLINTEYVYYMADSNKFIIVAFTWMGDKNFDNQVVAITVTSVDGDTLLVESIKEDGSAFTDFDEATKCFNSVCKKYYNMIAK